jgi:16S rRNA (guanine527-N7)-methyltransferase
MPVLLEYCLPLAKNGGMFVGMKGPSVEEELKVCDNALKVLGGRKPQIFTETLTGDEKRAFVLCKKISQTPSKYPRKPSDISKRPL